MKRSGMIRGTVALLVVVGVVLTVLFVANRKHGNIEKPLRLQDWFYSWNEFPAELNDRRKDDFSNISPTDYSGAESCKRCHEKNYNLWHSHPHRVMNAEANEDTVKGRFDGSVLEIHGGTATMFKDDGEYRMRLERDSFLREFKITNTIGSRMLQYYIGELIDGVPVEAEETKDKRLVLPVGFVLADDQWGPALGVTDSDEIDSDWDPFEGYVPVRYYKSCGLCHTVVPQGFRLLMDPNAVGLNKPPFHFETPSFLGESLKHMTDSAPPTPPVSVETLQELVEDVRMSYSPETSAGLGIRCESCHYGCREHVRSEGHILPRFVPSSPHIVPAGGATRETGRTDTNLNLACAQCHGTEQTTNPGGTIIRNSSEYRDAIAGHCYSELTCVKCHEPHTPTGLVWPKTPDQDDASCLECHKQFEQPEDRNSHTHHSSGSTGARCMNCHMPHVTEGLADVVRTHKISSPTDREIVESGATNACNLCHLDRSIGWTIGYLSQWYDKSYDVATLDRVYETMEKPAGKIWLNHDLDQFRLIAAGAAKRANSRWLTTDLVEQLDHHGAFVRWYTHRTLESVWDIDLEQIGYQYWMRPDERAQVLDNVREFFEKLRTNPSESSSE